MPEHSSEFRVAVSPLVRALKSSHDAAQIDDMDGCIAFVNDTWCRLFQRERMDVTGAEWDSLGIYPQHDAGLRESWDWCIADGSSCGAFRLLCANGDSLTIRYTRLLYRSANGAPTMTITIYKPESDAMRAQRGELPWDAALTSGGADKAALDPGRLEHRLRNLLATIRGIVYLLQQGADDRLTRRRLAVIQSALDSSVDLLGGMSRLSDR